MNTRRKFIQQSMLAAGFLAAPKGWSATGASTVQQPLLLPQSLRKGDLVALTAPAGAIFNEETVVKARAALENMGFRVTVGDTAKTRTGYLAGDDAFRAAEFTSFMTNKEVKAIVALRGGWGCARMLPYLDFTLFPENPKVISGFSDITTLLLALYAQTGMITFHGPVGNSTWEGATTENFLSVVSDAEVPFKMSNPEIEALVPGVAKGKLLGGNLSIICSLLGTSFLPDFTGSILFLEETEEEPYCIDRMLTQLSLAGILDKISGLVFGACTKCDPEDPEKSFTLDQVLKHHFCSRQKPAVKGFAIGHIKDKFTLPLGVEAELNAEKVTLTLTAAAVK